LKLYIVLYILLKTKAYGGRDISIKTKVYCVFIFLSLQYEN